MCTHQHLITNIYTKQEFYVKCGKCPACLQEKAAHRVARIKATDAPGLDVMMVSLTYRRGSAPYIDRQEAYEFARGKRAYLNVYRDTKYRRVRLDSDYNIGFKSFPGKFILTQIPFVSYDSFRNLKDMAHEHNKISVSYYPDVQRFMARLRINLKRLYNYDKQIYAYLCGEYGSKSHRTHFHIALHYQKGDYEVLRSAIVKSWPFSDLSRWDRAVEKAFRASSYLASYVNCGSDFPTFLKKYFKPKHSYSKGYGLGNSLYTLPSILEHFERGSLSFGMLKDKQGIPKIADVPFPSYVIHRYFPKFKGYSRLSPTSLEQVMRGIRNFDYDTTNWIVQRQAIYYSMEEFNKFSVMLNNAYQRFKDNCPPRYSYFTFENYVSLHRRIWSLFASTCLKLHLKNDDIPINEKYDNLDWVNYKKSLGFDVPGFGDVDTSVTNPNLFKSTIALSSRFEQGYYENIKHRKVSNAIMSIDSDEW